MSRITKEDMIKRLEHARVDYKTDRWAEGTPHRRDVQKIVKLLSSIDEHFFQNYFDWRIGGDGDNGETLMYELDVVFDLLQFEDII